AQLGDAVESLDIGVGLFGPDRRLVRHNRRFLPRLAALRGSLVGLEAQEIFDHYAEIGRSGPRGSDPAALRKVLRDLFDRADSTPFEQQIGDDRWFRYA